MKGRGHDCRIYLIALLILNRESGRGVLALVDTIDNCLFFSVSVDCFLMIEIKLPVAQGAFSCITGLWHVRVSLGWQGL